MMSESPNDNPMQVKEVLAVHLLYMLYLSVYTPEDDDESVCILLNWGVYRWWVGGWRTTNEGY